MCLACFGDEDPVKRSKPNGIAQPTCSSQQLTKLVGVNKEQKEKKT